MLIGVSEMHTKSSEKGGELEPSFLGHHLACRRLGWRNDLHQRRGSYHGLPGHWTNNMRPS